MIDRLHRALPWLLPLAMLACGDDSGPGGAETSTGSASTGSESSTGMTQATLSTSSDSDSASSGSSDDSSSGTSSGEPETSSSSGALVCDIVDVVEAAAVGKREPVDCGFVHLADPLMAWEATHDCVVENFGSDNAFTAVAELQGIDSEVYIGYAG